MSQQHEGKRDSRRNSNSNSNETRQRSGNKDYNRSVSAKPNEGSTKPRIKYFCWKCQQMFESETPLPRDATRCPYCNMIHGKITTDTFTHGYDSGDRNRGQARG
jgi:hypothetical protein